MYNKFKKMIIDRENMRMEKPKRITNCKSVEQCSKLVQEIIRNLDSNRSFCAESSIHDMENYRDVIKGIKIALVRTLGIFMWFRNLIIKYPRPTADASLGNVMENAANTLDGKKNK